MQSLSLAEGYEMKVLVLTGSPHARGTTAHLADEFCEGARETGNEVIRFDTAMLILRPCLGCGHCRANGGECIHSDDMRFITPELLSADVITLITPLYYHGMTSQLKRVIDRMYAPNHQLRGMKKRLLLIAAGEGKELRVMDSLVEQIRAICHYMRWDLGDMLLAINAKTREDVINTVYETTAREMGRGL
jgi:multimeric flavodoxin WrbA